MKNIYLDYNATTPIDPRVLEEMMPYLSENYGNPSSIHSFGRKGKEALDKAREQVSQLISASPKEIVFTSGGSEAANFAIKSTARSLLREKGSHIVTTRVEHECVLESLKFLEKEGFQVTYLGVNSDGLIDLEELKEAITDETILVSCMYANNETGVIFPIDKIAEIVKERGVIFHTDAVQAAGKIDIDLEEIPADLLSISAHKFYGPKSVGALFIRDSFSQQISLTPLIHGGGQERGKRSGTENIPGIVGLGSASDIASNEMRQDESRIIELRDQLFQSITQDIEGVKLNGILERQLWNTLNLSFEGVEGESLSMNLDIEGVAVSTGSACSEGTVDPSHVLSAMGLSKGEAASSVRISLGRFTEKEEINYIASIFPMIVERIRGVK
ncbi:MAG: cysteine desulfurase family protein [Candidatus Dadabacteria bacterium]|jgi:cysteine desulfurase|nr:cysteine desulfurase family protein [Candidatus Dadabacteria bacterium]